MRRDNDGFKRAVVETLGNEADVIATGDRVGFDEYNNELRSSLFCLVPPGFAPWSFRMSEALLSGCIPIFLKLKNVRMGCVDKDKVGLSIEQVPGRELIEELRDLKSQPDKIAAYQAAVAEYKGFTEYDSMTMECLMKQLMEPIHAENVN